MKTPIQNCLQMLKVSLLCLLCSTLPAIAEDGPSREETVAWLTGKINGYWFNVMGTAGDRDVLVTHTIKDFQVSPAGRLAIKLQLESSVGDICSRTVSVGYVPFNKLSPVCRVEQINQGFNAFSPVWRVSLMSSSGKSFQIIEQRGGGKSVYPVPLTYSQTFDAEGLVLNFHDEQLANRVARALEHLIKLSGGQREPF